MASASGILLTCAAAPIGAGWVWGRRNAYRRISTPLQAAVRNRLTEHFDAAFLSRVEVARVGSIANPIAGALGRFAPRGMLDLSTVRGMAFIDTIVIAESNAHHADNEISLIFHELVHLAQYDLLGTANFIRAYLSGWFESGRSYLDNPMEAMAFELQDRFDQGGPSFDVAEEVRRRLLPSNP